MLTAISKKGTLLEDEDIQRETAAYPMEGDYSQALRAIAEGDWDAVTIFTTRLGLSAKHAFAVGHLLLEGTWCEQPTGTAVCDGSNGGAPGVPP